MSQRARSISLNLGLSVRASLPIVVLLTGCWTVIEQQEAPLERAKTFAHPFEVVWDSAEQVMRAKQARPGLVDREAGLLQFAAGSGTYITVFVKKLDGDRTRVFVSRNRGAQLPISEGAILDEIARALDGRRGGQ